MKFTREQIVAALRKAAELKRITAELGCTDNGCVMSSEGVSDIGPDDPDFQVPFDDNGDPMAVPVNGRVQASAFDVMRGRKNAGRYPVMVHPDEDGYIDEDARFDAMHKSYLPEDGLPADFFMDNVREHDNTDAAIKHYMDNSPVSREYEEIRKAKKTGSLRAIDVFVRKEAIKLNPKLFSESVYAKLMKNPADAEKIAKQVARMQNRQIGNRFRVGGFKNPQANSHANADVLSDTLYGSHNATGIDLTKFLKERQGMGGLPWQNV